MQNKIKIVEKFRIKVNRSNMNNAYLKMKRTS